MSDTINLAGKDIIVDHVTTQDGSSGGLSILQMMNSKRNRNGVDGITAGTCRIGARASGTTLEIYAYNPLNSYSSDFGDDYYVNTGYVDCNGQSCPVFIPGKHISFPVTGGSFRQGTWSIIIYKASALDEVWSVKVAIPEPNNSTPPVMEWSDTLGGSVTIDTSVWVIGFFTFSSLDGVYNLFVNQNGTTPMSFLKDRFMQVINDCDGTDTTDYTNWATAMKCDAIFKRLAVLEAFVKNLRAQNLQVGTDGTGFCFQALTDDGSAQHNKVFNVKYGNNSLFRVDIGTGVIWFGNGFRYDPNYSLNMGAIRSNNDGVIIEDGGGITINNGMYRSNLVCPSFRSIPRATPVSPITITNPSNAASLAASLFNTYHIRDSYPCSVSGYSQIKYIVIQGPEQGTYGWVRYGFTGEDMNTWNAVQALVFYANADSSITSAGYAVGGGPTFTSSTIKIGTSSTVSFKLLNSSGQISIGSSTSGLETGELFYSSDGSGTGTLHIKL